MHRFFVGPDWICEGATCVPNEREPLIGPLLALTLVPAAFGLVLWIRWRDRDGDAVSPPAG
jgi:hypothetical protein